MTPHVPYFVRRMWRLIEARRALVEGAPERALGVLRDPTLAVSTQADLLRRRAMEALYRAAAQRASQGREGSVARLLGFVSIEDPARADEWRRHLAGALPERAPASQGGLRNLLVQMRSDGDTRDSGEPQPASEGPTGAASSPARRARVPAGRPLRFHLAVDEGGEFLVLAGESISLGHARAALADVPLLADLESIHARLTFGESFHGGPAWRIGPVGRGQVYIDGHEVTGDAELVDGALVRLSPLLSFNFRRPDPASGSALVELARGVETDGAGRILLLAPGMAGRVRIGSRASRHVAVAGLEEDIELRLEPEHGPTELVVRCGGGVRMMGAAQEAATELVLPCPPDRRLDVVLGARPSQRAPFGLSISPVEDPVQGPGGGTTMGRGPA